MNEKSKLRLVIAIMISIIVLVPTIILISEKENRKYISDLKEVVNGTTPTVIYLARPTCHFCTLLKPITNNLKDTYGISYHEINTDNISSTLLKKILKVLDIQTSEFGTPYLAIVQNGSVIGRQSGYDNEANTFNFFKTHGVINSEQNLWYEATTMEQLKSKKESNEKTFVLIGSDREEETLETKELLKTFAKDNSVAVSYLEIGSLTDTKELETLTNLTSEQLKHPVFIRMENGTIQAASANTKEAYLNLIK